MAEARKLTEDITVNDGGGLWDACGLIDTMILDCNNMVKTLIGGNYVSFCDKMAEHVRMLAVLKEGITNEKERGVENAAGSVHNTLDGTVGSGPERLADVIFTEGRGLEPDPDHAGT